MALIKIGTRASELAVWQAEHIKEKICTQFSDIDCELVYIKTQGDKLLNQHLALIGGKALFIKELEQALLENKIDLAVHSMKDIPTEIHPQLSISVISDREDPTDAFVSLKYKQFQQLPQKAKIGSSSLRRCAQLLHYRPDLDCQLLRGNVNSRLQKLKDEQYDAIILATAGLIRLKKEEYITERFSVDFMLPAISQGVLGIETRKNDDQILQYIQHIQNEKTAQEITCERSFLAELAANCQVPVAAFAQLQENNIFLRGMVLSIDGQIRLFDSITCQKNESVQAAKKLAHQLLEKGGKEILEKLKVHE